MDSSAEILKLREINADLESRVTKLATIVRGKPRALAPIESVCDVCGGENPVWFTINSVWNEVVAERTGFICPLCFIRRAERQGLECSGWKLIPDNQSVPLKSETVPTIPKEIFQAVHELAAINERLTGVPTEAAKPSPEAVKMRKFVNEHMMATGRNSPFLEANLPEPREIHDRTVRLPTAQLVKFRNDYLLMIHFAALKCGVEPDELCPLHLLAPFMKVESEDDDAHEF